MILTLNASKGAPLSHLRHGEGVGEEVYEDPVPVVEREDGEGEAHDGQEEVQGVPQAGEEGGEKRGLDTLYEA